MFERSWRFASISEMADYVHREMECKLVNGHCPIHAPSDHHMVDWPVELRSGGLMERICEHGVGHPDPDSYAYFESLNPKDAWAWGVHGCDGCCHTPEENNGEEK